MYFLVKLEKATFVGSVRLKSRLQCIRYLVSFFGIGELPFATGVFSFSSMIPGNA